LLKKTPAVLSHIHIAELALPRPRATHAAAGALISGIDIFQLDRLHGAIGYALSVVALLTNGDRAPSILQYRPFNR
jgi:hypothetical protein